MIRPGLPSAFPSRQNQFQPEGRESPRQDTNNASFEAIQNNQSSSIIQCFLSIILYFRLEINFLTGIYSSFLPYYSENDDSRFIVIEGEDDRDPNTFTGTFSDSYFSSKVGPLEFIKYINVKDNIYEPPKLKLYKNEKGSKFVLKTFWFDLKLKDRENKNEMLYKALSFAKNAYNEYSYLSKLSDTTYAVKPFGFNFIYIKRRNLLISELLEEYGGVSLSGRYFNCEQILSIIIQLAQCFNWLSFYKIAHNDIKPDNILILEDNGIIKIKLIDFDISTHQKITRRTTLISELKGFTNGYAAVEIINKANYNQGNNTIEYSPWSAQIYSLGILILNLLHFFDNGTIFFYNLDPLKASKSLYQYVYIALERYANSIVDPLQLKLIEIAKICIQFQPEPRPKAKELLDILKDLKKRNPTTIKEKYEALLKNRSNNTFPINSSINYITDLTLRNTIKDELVEQFNKYESQILELTNKNLDHEANLEKERMNSKKGIENLNIKIIEFNSIIEKLNKDKEELNNLVKSIEDSKNLEIQKANSRREKEGKEHEEKYNNMKNSLEDTLNKVLEENKSQMDKSLEEYNRKMQENEEFLKNVLLQNQQSMYEYSKNYLKTTDVIKQIKGFIPNMDFMIPTQYTKETFIVVLQEFSESLAKYFVKKRSKKDRLVKNVILDNFVDAYYTGPLVNERPEGAGILWFPNQNRKLIAEFKGGKIKDNIGMLTYSDNNFTKYLLGKINEDLSFNLSLILFVPTSSTVECRKYYLGMTNKECHQHGKGKFTYNDGSYYEGDFYSDKIEGIGKYFDQNGNIIYEGGWRKNKKHGDGKLYVMDNGVTHTQEGTWVKGERVGRFKIDKPGRESSYINFVKDKPI